MKFGSAGIYNQVAVETADQKSLILICYDEAIRALQIGKECYLKKEYEEKCRQFNRAQDFISELLTGLNMEVGGQIAQNLSAIYNFVISSIARADLARDMELIDRLSAMLTELRSAWAEIDRRPAARTVYEQRPISQLRGISV